MAVLEENRDKIIKAIMERYGGLTNMIEQWRDDVDVVLVNIADDANVEEDEVEEVINGLL